MELVKKNIHMEHRLNPTSVQISLEEDQNISDQKPDALRVICKKAEVKIGETKIQDESVLIKGNLMYRVLYLTDETEKRLCSMEGDIPFEERIYTNHMGMNEEIRVVTGVEDLMIRLINSRKLNIRCIITASVLCNALHDEEVVVDVESPDTCEILKKPIDITGIVLDTRDIYRVKDEINIPDGYPNVYSMIWKDICVEGLEFVPMDGRIGIRGEYKVFFMYDGEEEETVPRFFEVIRPIDGMLEVPECMENMTLYVDWEKEQPHFEVRSDYDGEERVLGMDMELKLYIKLYRNETLSVVTDAYGIQEELEPVMKEGTCECIIKKEIGKIRLGDVWVNPDEQVMDMQIMHVDCDILDEKTVLDENQLTIMGVAHVELLCATDDEGEPYRCIIMDLPYSQPVAVMGIQKDCQYSLKIEVEQIHAGIQGKNIDIRGSLVYQILVFRKTKEPMLIGMEKVTLNGQDKSLPVMSVYFAREKDTLWEIGKKYRVSLNDIRNENQINSDVLCGGERILITKESH